MIFETLKRSGWTCFFGATLIALSTNGTVCGQPFFPPAGTTINSVEEIAEVSVNPSGAFYDSNTGDVYVKIDRSVLVIGLEGAPFNLSNLNQDTALGTFEQADEGGIGQLDFGGLATGIFNFGSILPADPRIRTGLDFAAKYPSAIFRSSQAVFGISPIDQELRARFIVISSIPEPGSLPLLALILPTILFNRRRGSVVRD